jgi:hypothetical protein
MRQGKHTPTKVVPLCVCLCIHKGCLGLPVWDEASRKRGKEADDVIGC